MLSFQTCKNLLKKDTYNSQQIEEIRYNIYQVVELLVSNYISNKKNKLLFVEKVKKEK